MKSLLQKIFTTPFSGTLLLGLCLSQMLVFPIWADEVTNVSDIKGCRAIKGEAERLRCYDTVSDGGIFNEEKLKQVRVEEFGAQKMQKPPEPEPEPAPSAEPEPAPSATPKTVTAQESAPESAPEPAKAPEPETGAAISVDRLSVTIVRSQKDNRGFVYFQTSDGQVWKQQNAGGWSLTVPYDAVIKTGVFGSFFLVNEGGKSTRVKRVK